MTWGFGVGPFFQQTWLMGGCEGIFCLNVGTSKHVERNRCNKKEITLVMKQCSRECEKWCSETVHLWQQIWQRFFRNQIIFFVICSFLNVCKFFLRFSYWFSASFIFSKTSRTAISLASFFLFLSSYSILGPDNKTLNLKRKEETFWKQFSELASPLSKYSRFQPEKHQ